MSKLDTLCIKNEINSSQKNEISFLLEKKISFYVDVIQRTLIHVQKNKSLDILGISNINICVERLNEINNKIKTLTNPDKTYTKLEIVINDLQNINNDLSTLLKNYGTDKLEDLLLICFGANNKIANDDSDLLKLDLLMKYFHPTSYNVLNSKEEYKIKKKDKDKEKDKDKDKEKDNLIHLNCVDISLSAKQFHLKVYGMKLYIINEDIKKYLVIYGIVDDVMINYLTDKYITNKQNELILFFNKKLELNIPQCVFTNFINSLTLKDFLIYANNEEFLKKFLGINNQVNTIKQKPISSVIKEFIADDMYSKRNVLINLLLFSENYDNQYLSYLLYDLLSNETNGNVDTQEQTMLYDSFPWTIKEHFKNAMKKTIQYTNELSNFDFNKIPLEQQICLLKTTDVVKEKAMMKLKEVKAKSEDTGSKARQYIDGLLKIPFGIYKKEPILNIMVDIKVLFKELLANVNENDLCQKIEVKNNYNSFEIFNYIKNVTQTIKDSEITYISKLAKTYLLIGDKKQLYRNASLLYKIAQQHNINIDKPINGKKESIILYIENIIDSAINSNSIEFIRELYDFIKHNNKLAEKNNFYEMTSTLDNIKDKTNELSTYFTNVKNILNKFVYGHNNAKRHVERIIAQWINGEQQGYVFGFEGPPGVGKTSLAKGLANCLVDENGVSRPFSLIALGGDSNASSLIGHSYTYVGSTWGQILQILMDKKCMNPIILIDEVDKISKTENGKEIIGILTHLLDPTQNDTFQDKYFSGIDLDVSKILFILSYNDVNSIDKIMLDRIHRIKFENLLLEDKIVICNKYLLPEIYKNIGLGEVLHFSDDVLKFIIDEYTLEPGVRKLKELLFEIIGEINLEILNSNFDNEIPFNITIDNIKTKYLKDKREQIIRKVFDISKIGFVNGMYATALGNGGTLPIHAQFYPSDKFLDLKLTGLQQEVMKESMHVALTVAWNLTTLENQNKIRNSYDGIHKYGINIHTGDGSVQKDGPSAGCAITCAIYSIINNIPIKPEFAITGEIQMSGEVTAIGGLSNKIIGSIKASVKKFIYPKENQKDFDDFFKKYEKSDILQNIEFYPVSHVNHALKLILEQ